MAAIFALSPLDRSLPALTLITRTHCANRVVGGMALDELDETARDFFRLLRSLDDDQFEEVRVMVTQCYDLVMEQDRLPYEFGIRLPGVIREAEEVLPPVSETRAPRASMAPTKAPCVPESLADIRKSFAPPRGKVTTDDLHWSITGFDESLRDPSNIVLHPNQCRLLNRSEKLVASRQLQKAIRKNKLASTSFRLSNTFYGQASSGLHTKKPDCVHCVMLKKGNQWKGKTIGMLRQRMSHTDKLISVFEAAYRRDLQPGTPLTSDELLELGGYSCVLQTSDVTVYNRDHLSPSQRASRRAAVKEALSPYANKFAILATWGVTSAGGDVVRFGKKKNGTGDASQQPARRFTTWATRKFPQITPMEKFWVKEWDTNAHTKVGTTRPRVNTELQLSPAEIVHRQSRYRTLKTPAQHTRHIPIPSDFPEGDPSRRYNTGFMVEQDEIDYRRLVQKMIEERNDCCNSDIGGRPSVPPPAPPLPRCGLNVVEPVVGTLLDSPIETLQALPIALLPIPEATPTTEHDTAAVTTVWPEPMPVVRNPPGFSIPAPPPARPRLRRRVSAKPTPALRTRTTISGEWNFGVDHVNRCDPTACGSCAHLTNVETLNRHSDTTSDFNFSDYPKELEVRGTKLSRGWILWLQFFYQKRNVMARNVICYQATKESPDLDYDKIVLPGCRYIQSEMAGDFKNLYFEVTKTLRYVTPWHTKCRFEHNHELGGPRFHIETIGHAHNIAGFFFPSRDFPKIESIRKMLGKDDTLVVRKGVRVFKSRAWAYPLQGFNHRHTCRNCGGVYNHEHFYRRLDHSQRAEDCPMCANLVLRRATELLEVETVNQQHCDRATPFSGSYGGVYWEARSSWNEVVGDCGVHHCDVPASLDEYHCLPDIWTDGSILKLRPIDLVKNVIVPTRHGCTQLFPITGKVVTHGRIGKDRYGFSLVPCFESPTILVSGTPIFDAATHELISLVTTSVDGRKYAVTNIAFDSLDVQFGCSISQYSADAPSYGSVVGHYADVKTAALAQKGGPDGMYINIHPNRLKIDLVQEERVVMMCRRFGGGHEWTNRLHSGRGRGRGRGAKTPIPIPVTQYVRQVVDHQIAMANAEAKTNQVKAEVAAVKSMAQGLARTANMASQATQAASSKVGVVVRKQQTVKRKPPKKKPTTILEKATSLVTLVIVASILCGHVTLAATKPRPIGEDLHRRVERAAPVEASAALASRTFGQMFGSGRVRILQERYGCKPAWTPADKLSVADANIANCYTQFKNSVERVSDCAPILRKLSLMKSDFTMAYFTETAKVLADYDAVEADLLKCTDCYAELAKVSMLAAHTISGHANLYLSIGDVNKGECQSKVDEVTHDIKEAANDTASATMPTSPSTLFGCTTPVAAWKQFGFLASSDGRACHVVDSMNVTYSSATCEKHKYFNFCHSQVDTQCRLGFGNASTGTTVTTGRSHATSSDVCCSAGCYSEEELLLAMSNQPMCSPCFKFFRHVFWDSCEFEETRTNYEGIQIYSDKTVFIMATGRRDCKNKASFSSCCNGRGPVRSDAPAHYFEKFCACTFEEHSSAITWAKKIKHVIRLVASHPYVAALVAILILRPKTKILVFTLLLVIIAYQWSYASAACTVNNVVPLGEASTYETSNLDQVTISISQGDCFSVAGVTVEVKAVRVTHLYQFDMAVPFKTKLICHEFDWGCQGGKASTIWGQSSDCYIQCGIGLRIKLKDTVSSWAGAGCFVLSGIAARYDACFSLGAPQTFSLVYNRITDTPKIEIDAIIHQGHSEKHVSITEENSKTGAGFTMRATHASSISYPHQIVRRNGETFCTYHYNENNRLCSSNSLEDLTAIDPDCLDAKIEWDVKEHQYAMTYKPHDFESVLKDHYVACPKNSNTTWNKYEAQYSNSVDSVDVEITGHGFKLNEFSTAMCTLGEYKLKSEPGIQGYHKTTSISIESDKSCCVGISSHECEATNGGLLCSKSTAGRSSSTWWCSGNDTTEFTVMLKDSKTEKINLKVTTNWKPHLNVWKTWNLPKVDRFSFIGSAAWISAQVEKGVSAITRLLSSNWVNILLIAGAGYIGVINLLRGKAITGLLFVAGAYLAYSLPGAYAVDPSQMVGNSLNATWESVTLLLIILSWAGGCGYGTVVKNKFASCWPYALSLTLWAFDFEILWILTPLLCAHIYWASAYFGKPSNEIWDLADHNIFFGYITDWKDDEDTCHLPSPAIRYCSDDGESSSIVVVPQQPPPGLTFSNGTYWYAKENDIVAAVGCQHVNPLGDDCEVWYWFLEEQYLNEMNAQLKLVTRGENPWGPGASGRYCPEADAIFIGLSRGNPVFEHRRTWQRIDTLARAASSIASSDYVPVEVPKGAIPKAPALPPSKLVCAVHQSAQTERVPTWSVDTKGMKDGIYYFGNCWFDILDGELESAFGHHQDNHQGAEDGYWAIGDASNIFDAQFTSGRSGFDSLCAAADNILRDAKRIDRLEGEARIISVPPYSRQIVKVKMVKTISGLKASFNALKEDLEPDFSHGGYCITMRPGHLRITVNGKNLLFADIEKMTEDHSRATYKGVLNDPLTEKVAEHLRLEVNTPLGSVVLLHSELCWVVAATYSDSDPTRVRGEFELLPIIETLAMPHKSDGWVPLSPNHMVRDPYGTKYTVIRGADRIGLRNSRLWPQHVDPSGDYACFDTRTDPTRQFETSRIRNNWFVWGTHWKMDGQNLVPVRKRLGLISGTCIVTERRVGPPTLARWQKVRLVRCNANVISGAFIYQNEGFWRSKFIPVAVVTGKVEHDGVDYIVLSSPYDDFGQFPTIDKDLDNVPHGYNIEACPPSSTASVRHWSHWTVDSGYKTVFLDRNRLAHATIESDYSYKHVNLCWKTITKQDPPIPSNEGILVVAEGRLASRDWLKAWTELLDNNAKGLNRLNNYGGCWLWVCDNQLVEWREAWVSVCKALAEKQLNNVAVDLSLAPFNSASPDQLIQYLRTHCPNGNGVLRLLYGGSSIPNGCMAPLSFRFTSADFQHILNFYRELRPNLTHTQHLTDERSGCNCYIHQLATEWFSIPDEVRHLLNKMGVDEAKWCAVSDPPPTSTELQKQIREWIVYATRKSTGACDQIFPLSRAVHGREVAEGPLSIPELNAFPETGYCGHQTRDLERALNIWCDEQGENSVVGRFIKDRLPHYRQQLRGYYPRPCNHKHFKESLVLPWVKKPDLRLSQAGQFLNWPSQTEAKEILVQPIYLSRDTITTTVIEIVPDEQLLEKFRPSTRKYEIAHTHAMEDCHRRLRNLINNISARHVRAIHLVGLTRSELEQMRLSWSTCVQTALIVSSTIAPEGTEPIDQKLYEQLCFADQGSFLDAARVSAHQYTQLSAFTSEDDSVTPIHVSGIGLARYGMTDQPPENSRLFKNFGVGVCRTTNKTGSFCVSYGSLVTSYHVTKGNPITITLGSEKFTFKPHTMLKVSDMAVYGRECHFAQAHEGDILLAFNPATQFALLFKVVAIAPLPGRAGGLFYNMIPIVYENDEIVLAPWARYPGMSGSPIINHNGELVTIYGLGTTITQNVDGQVISVLQQNGPMKTISAASGAFFSQAVETALSEAARSSTYTYLCAPTGTGKTTQFVTQLLCKVGRGKTIILLQPTVQACKNTFAYITSLMQGNSSEITDWRITCDIGRRNEESHQEEQGTAWSQNGPQLCIFTTEKWFRTQHAGHPEFLILDECHKINDVQMVKADIFIECVYKRGRPITYVKMTASPVCVDGGFDLACGNMLSATNFTITDSKMRVVNGENDLRDGEIMLPARIFCRGSDKNYAMVPDISGNTLVFVSTRNQCTEALAILDAALNALNPGKWNPTVALHAGCPANIAQIQTPCFIVATNYVEQSVTIQNLCDVVDWQEENTWKPEVFKVTEPNIVDSYSVHYTSSNHVRAISLESSLQRKGRCGRVREGRYWTRSDAAQLVSRKYDETIIPDLIMQLEGKVPAHCWATYSNKELVEAMNAMTFITPAELNKRFVDFQGTRRVLARNWGEIWSFVRDVNCDAVGLYLMPCATEELRQGLHQLCMEKSNSRPCDLEAFNKFWEKYSLLIGTINDFGELHRTNVRLGMLNTIYHPDEVMQIASETLQQETGMSALGEVQDSWTLPFATGLAAIGTLLAASAGLGLAIDRHATRQVVEYYDIKHVDVLRVARWVYKRRQSPQFTKRIRSAWAIAYAWLKDNWYQLRDKVKSWMGKGTDPPKAGETTNSPPSSAHAETQDSWESLLGQLGTLVELAYLKLQHAMPWFVWPHLAPIFGNGVLGAMYQTLCDSIGVAMTCIFFTVINALILFMGGVSVFAASAVTYLASGIIAAVIKSVRTPSSRYGAKPDDCGIWGLIASLAAGAGLGYAAQSHMAMVTAATSTSGHLHHAMSLTPYSTTGGFNNGYLIMQNVYYVITHAGTHSYIDCAPAVLEIAARGLLAGPITMICATTSGILIGGLYLMAKRYITTFAKEARNSEAALVTWREMVTNLDKMFDAIIYGTAVLINPLSVISIIIGCVNDFFMGRGINLHHNAAKYSGNSPLAALLGSALEWCRFLAGDDANVGEVHDNLTTALSAIGGASTLFWVLWTCGGEVAAWLKKQWLACSAAIKNKIYGSTRAVGENLGVGLLKIIPKNQLTDRLLEGRDLEGENCSIAGDGLFMGEERLRITKEAIVKNGAGDHIMRLCAMRTSKLARCNPLVNDVAARIIGELPPPNHVLRAGLACPFDLLKICVGDVVKSHESFVRGKILRQDNTEFVLESVIPGITFGRQNFLDSKMTMFVSYRYDDSKSFLLIDLKTAYGNGAYLVCIEKVNERECIIELVDWFGMLKSTTCQRIVQEFTGGMMSAPVQIAYNGSLIHRMFHSTFSSKSLGILGLVRQHAVATGIKMLESLFSNMVVSTHIFDKKKVSVDEWGVTNIKPCLWLKHAHVLTVCICLTKRKPVIQYENMVDPTASPIPLFITGERIVTSHECDECVRVAERVSGGVSGEAHGFAVHVSTDTQAGFRWTWKFTPDSNAQSRTFNQHTGMLVIVRVVGGDCIIDRDHILCGCVLYVDVDLDRENDAPPVRVKYMPHPKCAGHRVKIGGMSEIRDEDMIVTKDDFDCLTAFINRHSYDVTAPVSGDADPALQQVVAEEAVKAKTTEAKNLFKAGKSRFMKWFHPARQKEGGTKPDDEASATTDEVHDAWETSILTGAARRAFCLVNPPRREQWVKDLIEPVNNLGLRLVPPVNTVGQAREQGLVDNNMADRGGVKDPDSSDIYYDVTDCMFKRLVHGFGLASFTPDKCWTGITRGEEYRPAIPDVHPKDVFLFHQGISHQTLVTGKQWERVERAHVYELPRKHAIQNARGELVPSVRVASRGYYKFQGLYHQDPKFFTDDVKLILDPACGFGGFAHAYCQLLQKSRSKRYYLMSTLEGPDHARPEMDIIGQVAGAVNPIPLTSRLGETRGNIKDPRLVNLFRDAIEQLGLNASGAGNDIGKVDLIISDFGEMKNTEQSQANVWLKAPEDKPGLPKEVTCSQCDDLRRRRNDPNRLCDVCNRLLAGKQPYLTDLTAGLRRLQDRLLRRGGKMLIKMTGVFTHVHGVLNSLCARFENIRISRAPTCSKFSPEFYIWCSGFLPSMEPDLTMINTVVAHASAELYTCYQEAQTLLCMARSKGQSDHLTVKRWPSWMVPPGGVGICERTVDRAMGWPAGLKIKDSDGKMWLWEPDWQNRLQLLKQRVAHELGRAPRFTEIPHPYMNNVKILGRWERGENQNSFKNTKVGLVDDFAAFCFSLNDDTATYTHTQCTTEFKAASIKKRLDIQCDDLPRSVTEDFMRISQLLMTEWGKKHQNSLGLMTKEEVMHDQNNKGACGFFSDSNNIRQYQEKHPDWYERALGLVHCWQRGETTASYMTAMHKTEPSMKKNCSDGRIDMPEGCSAEDLKAFNGKTHRYIQFMDELTRLANYILVGKLLRLANENKIYKGTINGTPVMHQGKVMRAIWDSVNTSDPIVLEGDNPHIGVTYTQVPFPTETQSDGQAHRLRGQPAAVGLDFSAFDGTVTTEELAVAALFFTQFFQPGLKEAVWNWCMEEAFPIVVMRDGWMFVRAGQVCSGSVFTSLRNTFLSVVNGVRAISKSLGCSFEDVCKTVGVVNFTVGEMHADPKTGQLLHVPKVKTIEVMRIPVLADGDDQQIITEKSVASRIVQFLPGHMNEQCKTVHAGVGQTTALVTEFEKIQFCSHRYEPVLIGPGASLMQGDAHKIDAVCRGHAAEEDLVRMIQGQRNCHIVVEELPQTRVAKWQLWWLPSRPISDIFSRLRLSVKHATHRWNPNNELCRTLTRSKIFSYLLMYPHIKTVRVACLTMLAKIGGTQVDMGEFRRRWGDLTDAVMGTDTGSPEPCTLAGAFKSVYGVNLLDSISFRNPRVEASDLRDLSHNVSLEGGHFPKGKVLYIRMMDWLGPGASDVGFLAMDGTTARAYTERLTMHSSYDAAYQECRGNARLINTLQTSMAHGSPHVVDLYGPEATHARVQIDSRGVARLPDGSVFKPWSSEDEQGKKSVMERLVNWGSEASRDDITGQLAWADLCDGDPGGGGGHSHTQHAVGSQADTTPQSVAVWGAATGLSVVRGTVGGTPQSTTVDGGTAEGEKPQLLDPQRNWIREVFGNILTAPLTKGSALLHCISADCALSAGLAQQIDIKWQVKDKLPPAPNIGDAIIVEIGSTSAGTANAAVTHRSTTGQGVGSAPTPQVGVGGSSLVGRSATNAVLGLGRGNLPKNKNGLSDGGRGSDSPTTDQWRSPDSSVGVGDLPNTRGLPDGVTHPLNEFDWQPVGSRAPCIINMVTKNKKHQKPLLNTVVSTLENALAVCSKNKINQLHLPRIGSGLDRIPWPSVEAAIRPVLKRWVSKDPNIRQVTIWNSDPLTHVAKAQTEQAEHAFRLADLDMFHERIDEALSDIFGVSGVEGSDISRRIHASCSQYLGKLIQARDRAIAAQRGTDRAKSLRMEHEIYALATTAKTSELTNSILRAQRELDDRLKGSRPPPSTRKAARALAEAMIDSARQGTLQKIEFLPQARNVPKSTRRTEQPSPADSRQNNEGSTDKSWNEGGSTKNTGRSARHASTDGRHAVSTKETALSRPKGPPKEKQRVGASLVLGSRAPAERTGRVTKRTPGAAGSSEPTARQLKGVGYRVRPKTVFEGAYRSDRHMNIGGVITATMRSAVPARSDTCSTLSQRLKRSFASIAKPLVVEQISTTRAPRRIYDADWLDSIGYPSAAAAMRTMQAAA